MTSYIWIKVTQIFNIKMHRKVLKERTSNTILQRQKNKWTYPSHFWITSSRISLNYLPFERYSLVVKVRFVLQTPFNLMNGASSSHILPKSWLETSKHKVDTKRSFDATVRTASIRKLSVWCNLFVWGHNLWLITSCV